jgi:hypothetical protein
LREHPRALSGCGRDEGHEREQQEQGSAAKATYHSSPRLVEEAVGRPDLPESQPGFSPGPGQGKIITVVNGMSLSGIAETEYGSQELCPLIYDENKARIGPNPNLARVGLRLSIAPLTRYSVEQMQNAERRVGRTTNSTEGHRQAGHQPRSSILHVGN